jgi:hypothetical protein
MAGQARHDKLLLRLFCWENKVEIRFRPSAYAERRQLPNTALAAPPPFVGRGLGVGWHESSFKISFYAQFAYLPPINIL